MELIVRPPRHTRNLASGEKKCMKNKCERKARKRLAISRPNVTKITFQNSARNLREWSRLKRGEFVACVQVISFFIYYVLTRQKRIDDGEPANFNDIFRGTCSIRWDLKG